MSPLTIICKSIGAFTIVIYSLLIAFLIAYRRQFNTSFLKIFTSLGIADILQRIVTELFIFSDRRRVYDVFRIELKLIFDRFRSVCQSFFHHLRSLWSYDNSCQWSMRENMKNYCFYTSFMQICKIICDKNLHKQQFSLSNLYYFKQTSCRCKTVDRCWFAIVGQWVLALAFNAFLYFAPCEFVSIGQNSVTVAIFSLLYTQVIDNFYGQLC